MARFSSILTVIAFIDAADGANCPIACPYGWNKWGPFSKSCYLLPAQPLHKDTFWNQQASCRAKEPTSNILVINDLVEQALATAVGLQYSPSFLSQSANIHLWVGGYTDAANKWHFVDGTDQSSSILMTTANLGAKENDTCIGSIGLVFGTSQTYSCEDETGAVICEMPQRPVCDGRTGGILPLSPIDVGPVNGLLPKAPSIPIVGQLLGGGSVDG